LSSFTIKIVAVCAGICWPEATFGIKSALKGSFQASKRSFEANLSHFQASSRHFYPLNQPLVQ
jgi:hypothetical protein